MKAFIVRGGKVLTKEIRRTTMYANVALKRIDSGRSGD